MSCVCVYVCVVLLLLTPSVCSLFCLVAPALLHPLFPTAVQAGSINADVQGQVFVEVLALLLESAGTIVRSSSDFQAVAEFLMAVAETSPHLGTCHHGVTLLIELGLALGSLDPGPLSACVCVCVFLLVCVWGRSAVGAGLLVDHPSLYLECT